jgi:molecular chaperone GrpE
MEEPEIANNSKEEAGIDETKNVEETTADKKVQLAAELQEMNDKYIRLYAEFDNYRKRVNKDREELIKYANEGIIYQLLPVIDNLEMALKHSNDSTSSGLVQGVENTLREFLRTLEKFGLNPIEAVNKPFDPSLHEAMCVIERKDIEENLVVEEFRKGYIFKEKVLRPSLVSVSKRPKVKDEKKTEEIRIIEEGS